MNQEPFDGIARRTAAGLSRRSSLLALGGVALAAAITEPPRTEAARKNRKKNSKKARKQARKLCRRQVGQCHDFLEWACADQACVDRLEPCCDAFAKCDASTALQCIFAPEADEA